MQLRNPNEPHRVATPLELLFDLIYVVAIASTAKGLHHSLLEHHFTDGILQFLLSFFILWNAWAEFTWFASSYDSDDTFYRLSVFVQMFGSLMIAVGIGQLFESGSFVIVTVGYTVKRLALLSQWLRIYKDEPSRREVAQRYLLATTLLQISWISLLFLPERLQLPIIAVMVIAELWSSRWVHGNEAGSWHPHHIAERYGLLVIIVLGEGILGTFNTISVLYNSHHGDITALGAIFFVGLGVMGLIFALWWLYFAMPFGHMLEQKRQRSLVFIFNYGHFFIFASLTGLGSALELVSDTLNSTGHGKYGEHGGHVMMSAQYAMAVLTIMLVIYLLALSGLRSMMMGKLTKNIWVLLGAVGILLFSYGLVMMGLPIVVGIWVSVLAPILMIMYVNRWTKSFAVNADVSG